MKSNPLKDKGFVVGDYSQENYDKIDLHRPYVDNIVLVNDEGKPMYRESDLIDVGSTQALCHTHSSTIRSRVRWLVAQRLTAMR